MRNYLTRIPRASLILAILTLALYLPGFWWGAPHATAPDRIRPWGTDDLAPLGPLADMHNIIQPKADRWLSYPLMHSFITTAAYLPYLGYLAITGKLTTISATYPFGLADPLSALIILTMIGHLVSVLMGVVTVVAVHDAGRTLWDNRTGILAALLVMVSFPLTYYARTSNVDATVLCFVVLAMAAYARSVMHGLSIRRSLWLGIFVGCALASKELSVGMFLAIPIVLLMLQTRSMESAEGWWRAPYFWKAVILGFFSALLAFAIGSGLLVAPERYFAHVQYLRGLEKTISSGATPAADAFTFTWSGTLAYALANLQKLVDALTLPGFLLAIAGIAYTVKREPRSATLAILGLTYLIFLLATHRLAQMRYLMPVIVLLLLFMARVVVTGVQAPSRSLRAGLLFLGLAVFGVELLRYVDLTYQMINDSRYSAGAWLAEHTHRGDTVEYFGPISKLPSLKAGIIARPATEYRGMYVPLPVDDAKVREILAGWRERDPRFVIIMPDHTKPKGEPYSHTCPPQLYHGLIAGTMGYRLAAHFHTPPLFPWLSQPRLDYPTVNPPIRVFVRDASGQPAPGTLLSIAR